MRTQASFGKPEEAHLLRARLEGSGIAAYVRDENIVTADWLYSRAVGGVKVDVADEDFAAASDLLKHDLGESNGSLKKIQTYSRWHYVRVFVGFALFAFVVVGARNGVIAQPGMYTTPGMFGILIGSLATVVAVVRSRAKK
jgi:hypothetical protein